MANIIVNNSAELNAALKLVKGGENIILKAGNYGDVNISNYKYASEVTITSENPNDPAVITYLRVSGVENITFDNLKFDYTWHKGDPTWEYVMYASNSKNLAIKNSVFDGYVIKEGEGVPNVLGTGLVKSDPIEGFATGSGLRLESIDGLIVQNNEISKFGDGAVVVSRSQNVLISENEIHSMRQDGIKMAQNKNVLVEDNYIHDFAPWVGPAGTVDTAIGDHSDLIQMWTNRTTQASENIVVRDNILDSGSSPYTQAIFMRNDLVDQGLAGSELVYKNVTISNNVIHNAHTHGITIGATEGLTITNNTIVKNSTIISTMDPGINVSGTLLVPTTNAVIDGNVVGRINLNENVYLTGKSNNLIVDYNNTSADNFYAKYFVNVLDGIKDFNNFTFLGDFEGGSSLTKPKSAVYFIENEAGEGVNIGQHTLALKVIAPNGVISNVTGANVVWTFENGKTVSGQTVQSGTLGFGKQDVEVKISIPGKTDVTLSKSIVVETPVALKINFEGSEKDSSAMVNASEISGKVSYEGGKTGKAIRLDAGSFISYKSNNEMYGNDSYTISLDFKKDSAEKTGEMVHLLNFAGGASIRIRDDSLRIDYLLDNKESGGSLIKNLPLNNTDWNSLKVVFSHEEGKMTLELNGQQVWEKTGIVNSQIDSSSAPFIIGDPYAKTTAFKGLIDNVVYVRGVGEVPEDAVNDTVVGTISPNLVAAAETKTLYGSDQNDSFKSTGIYDAVFGQGGDDYIRGAKNIHGGDGNDSLFANGNGSNIFGGDGDDTLVGYDSNDVLHGGKGVDTLKSGAGDDMLYFDAEDKGINGGLGNDTAIYTDGGLLNFAAIRVEKLDVKNNLQNTVKIELLDVLQSDNDILFITGDADDVVQLMGKFSKLGDVTVDGQDYNEYTAMRGGTTVKVVISDLIAVDIF